MNTVLLITLIEFDFDALTPVGFVGGFIGLGLGSVTGGTTGVILGGVLQSFFPWVCSGKIAAEAGVIVGASIGTAIGLSTGIKCGNRINNFFTEVKVKKFVKTASTRDTSDLLSPDTATTPAEPVVTATTSACRAFSQFLSNQYAQTYFSLTVYLFLAILLCGLLAGLAYLFSISTAQETEKRSEYECGFAPFDSATRLPFDVHFYLVGILFLIFDVEVALLFPWVLSLRTVGWFGFYLMLSFLLILSVGFLYEWKRGALIWPTRFSKVAKSATLRSSLTFITMHDDRHIPRGFLDALYFQLTTYWPLMILIAFTVLRLAAVLYTRASKKKNVVTRQRWFAILFAFSLIVVLQACVHSTLLLVALLINSALAWHLERNPFFPHKTFKETLFPLRATGAQCVLWAGICLMYFTSFFISSLYTGLKFVYWKRFELKRHFRAMFHRSQASRSIRNKIKVLGQTYTNFDFSVMPLGFRRTVHAYFVAPARHIADFLEPITAAMNIYTACGLFLIFTTLYTLAHLHTRFTLYANLKGRLDPKVFGIRQFTAKEVLFFILVFAAAVLAFTNALWHFGVNLTEHQAFVHFVLPDLIFFKSPEFFLTTLPHYLSVVAPAALNALIYTDLPQAVTATIDFATSTLPTFLFDILPGRLATEIPKIPGQLLQYYVENLQPYVKVVQSVLNRFSAWQLVLLALLIIPLFVRGNSMPYDYYDYYFGWSVWKNIRANFYHLLIWVYLVPAGDAAAFIYNRFLLKHYWKGVTPQFVKDSDDDIRAYKDEVALHDADYAADLAEERRAAWLAAEKRQKEAESKATTTHSASLFAGLLGNLSDDTVLQATTLFAVPSIIVLIALALRNCQLRQQLWQAKAFLAANAKARAEEAAILSRCDTVTKALVPYKGASMLLAVFANANEKASAVHYANTYFDIMVLCLCLSALLLASNVHLALEYRVLRIAEHMRQQEERKQKIAKNKKKAHPWWEFFFPVAAADEATTIFDGFTSLKTALLTGDTTTFPMLAEGLLFTIVCLILVNLSIELGKEHNKRLLARQAWRALSVGFAAVAAVYTYQFFFFSEAASVLGGYFATSRTTTLLKLVTLLSALFVLDSSEKFMRRHERHLLEYPIMLALTTFFMLLLIGADHVMSSFLALVGFSLGLYVLILYDANQRPSREAGLKYYYLSTLSSGFILYGMLLVYSLTGTGNFEELFELFNTRIFYRESPILRIASVLILVGFFFKLSAFPGHLWAADVYEGSPAPVTGFFMLPVKIAVLGGFIRLFTVAFAPLAAYWLPILTATVVISILWGAFASLQEKKVRRFLAYASINQMGFLLMGLTTDSDAGFRAAILYILIYAVMTCAFLTIFLSARRADGAELIYISDFRTLASRNWLVGWSLAVVLFSMAGIPPLGGFFAKYFVLLHAFEKGLMLEVIVGLATSLISTYYYLRIIKIVKFEQPDGAMPSSPELTPRHQGLLRAAEALLWSFVVCAPAIIGMLHTLTPSNATGLLF